MQHGRYGRNMWGPPYGGDRLGWGFGCLVPANGAQGVPGVQRNDDGLRVVRAVVVGLLVVGIEGKLDLTPTSLDDVPVVFSP